jgi:D-lactate dehydrogenase
MRIAFFSTKPYDRDFFTAANGKHGHALSFLEPRLTPETVSLARGFEAVCAFVNDQLDAGVLEVLAAGGTRLVALRSSGYNHVDLPAATRLGLTVVHVPRYSPHAVAEHAVALMLALNRHIHRAHNRVREGNFSINGLLGFDMFGKTVGIVGAGRIGLCVAQILQGFRCQVLMSDPNPPADALASGFPLCSFEEILLHSDVITLQCPLLPATRHLVHAETIAQMKRGVMLINTSRGGLVDTRAVIDGLLSGQIGYLGIDVYEEEAALFYEDRSNTILGDEVFSRLLTLPNVLVTGHQAFFTREAITTIAGTTLASVSAFAAGTQCGFALPPAGATK